LQKRRSAHTPQPLSSEERRFARGTRTLADLLAPAAVEVARNHVRLEYQYARVLVVIGYPRTVAAGWLTPLLEFEYPIEISVHVHPLEASLHTVEELRNNTLIFYTGIVRRSFDILQQQRKDTEAGDRSVVDSLHATKEIGVSIKTAIESGDLDEFGRLLDVHWQNKKRRSSKISDGHLDDVYDLAKRNGALGGKLMGAGGGGFFLFYAPNGRKPKLREAMAVSHLREMLFDVD